MRVCIGTPGNPCAKLVPKGNRCTTCKRDFQRQRKAAGRTGERGSTAASRQRRANVLAKANHRCFYCTAPATIADHYIPLALEGPDTDENMVAACERCNSQKGDQMPGTFLASEWLRKRRAAVEAMAE